MFACFIWHHPPVGVDSVDKSGSGIRRSSSPVSQGSSSTTTATTATRATSLTATSRIPRPFTVPRISCARCGMRSTISKASDQRGFEHVPKDEKILLGYARDVRERHTIHLRNMNQEHWSIYSRTSAFIQSYYLNDDLQFIDVRAFNDASSVVYIWFNNGLSWLKNGWKSVRSFFFLFPVFRLHRSIEKDGSIPLNLHWLSMCFLCRQAILPCEKRNARNLVESIFHVLATYRSYFE